ncbi:MAG: PKD domain-containing protein, partial [Paracoccaceae bacterium]
VNAQPTALAGPDQLVCPGDLVVFDAGASSDLDGEITDYEWIFGDGTILNGPRVERVFESSGKMLVTLNVRDNSGATGCDVGADTAWVLVNTPPSIDAGPHREVPVGASFDVERFEPEQAQDADGQGLRLSWNFGEGADVPGRVARHRFSGPGDYMVTLTAQDSSGLACGVSQHSLKVTATARE